MDMDGKTVRVDKVDFPNEEVSLTDITDRKIPFHSMSGCLLSAPMWRKLRLKASGKQWIAESIPLRRRLLSSQSSKNTPRLRRTKVLKSLSKQRNRNQKKWRCDYVFTVEETNLMCCFDTSSRKRLIAEMKSLPINELDDEMAELLFIPFGSLRVSPTRRLPSSTSRRTV